MQEIEQARTDENRIQKECPQSKIGKSLQHMEHRTSCLLLVQLEISVGSSALVRRVLSSPLSLLRTCIV